MKSLLVRKPNGDLIECKTAMAKPELLFETHDPETLMSNMSAIVAKTQTAMQSAQQSSNWKPDKEWTVMEKNTIDNIKSLKTFQDNVRTSDALAALPDHELFPIAERIIMERKLKPQ